MKVLFDNNVPAPLRRHLPGHDVSTAYQMGWHQLENGNLLAAAEQAGFEAMVSGDQNLSYQQNLTHRKLALVILSTNRWSIIKQSPELVAAALDNAPPNSFREVEFEQAHAQRRGRKPKR